MDIFRVNLRCSPELSASGPSINQTHMKSFLIGLLSLWLLPAWAQAQGDLPQKDSLVVIHTPYGDMTVVLYYQTPVHRANFLKLASEGFYDSTLFHRVIEDFMIQGGDPNSKNLNEPESYGHGGPGYTLPAEIRPELYHRRGVLAAARLGDIQNPERESSGSQFYIVQGKPLTDEELTGVKIRMRRLFPAYEMTEAMRQTYQDQGGTPWLDMQYTIFGEVIDGMEVVDQIAEQPVKYAGSIPETPIPITMEIMVMKRKKVEKKLGYAYPTSSPEPEAQEAPASDPTTEEEQN